MKSSYTFALTLNILIGWCSANAQAPGWSVNSQAYQYTMTIVAFLTVDGEVLTTETDRVAAFVDGEVRGAASPMYVPSADRYLVYLTVFANKAGETVEFRIYDSSADRVVDTETSVPFSIDGQHGGSFQAFSIANPPLGSQAEVLSYFFTDADSVSTRITDGFVDVVLEYDEDIKALTPDFVLSAGAKMYLNRVLLQPGMATYDFSQPIVFSVLSEDESILKSWEIRVSNREIADGGFTSTNVITPNGDGANDFWIVQDVFKYKNHSFRILDANGRTLHESTGYNNDWGGLFKGTRIDRGKYYYVIKDPETNTIIQGDILVVY